LRPARLRRIDRTLRELNEEMALWEPAARQPTVEGKITYEFATMEEETRVLAPLIRNMRELQGNNAGEERIWKAFRLVEQELARVKRARSVRQ
jgi:hypothetical protein